MPSKTFYFAGVLMSESMISASYITLLLMGDFSHQCKNAIFDVIAKLHCIIFLLSNDILEIMDGTGKYYTE